MKYFLIIVFFLSAILSAMENNSELATIMENKSVNLISEIENKIIPINKHIIRLDQLLDRLQIDVEHLKDSQKITDLKIQDLSLTCQLLVLEGQLSKLANK